MASTPDPTNPLPIADPPPPKDTTGTKFVIPYTYLGTRTTPPGAGSPDVLLLPGPPAGRLYFLQGILVTASIVEKYPWDQNSFLYDKVLNGSTWEAWTPNLDAVGKLEVPADFVGTRVGGGGYAETFPKPKDAVTWKDYALPIPQTPSIQVQVGSNLGAGNSLLIQETFLDGGPAEEIRFTNGSKVTNGFTDDAEPVPAGFEDLITTAFV